MPRPPADSRLDVIYARSSNTSRSTAMVRSMAGFTVSVTIKFLFYWRAAAIPVRPAMLPCNLRHHPGIRAYFALVAVSFVWGTTYLGIRMALETFPPLVLVATRFTLSGSILVAASLARGARRPRGRDLLIAALSGILILGIGNGCLTFAELLIPSGLAGMISTLSPFWLVGIEAAMPGGERLHVPTILGMIVGFGAVGLLLSGAVCS